MGAMILGIMTLSVITLRIASSIVNTFSDLSHNIKLTLKLFMDKTL
jgi:hypothetical protein